MHNKKKKKKKNYLTPQIHLLKLIALSAKVHKIFLVQKIIHANLLLFFPQPITVKMVTGNT